MKSQKELNSAFRVDSHALKVRSKGVTGLTELPARDGSWSVAKQVGCL